MTWRDVTAECEWVDGRLIHEYETEWAHHRTTICGGENYLHPGYRLTKISGPLTPHVAFIVEKRE